MKSGNLNVLEPSGPFQACNGAALPDSEKTSSKCVLCNVTHVTDLNFHLMQMLRFTLKRKCNVYIIFGSRMYIFAYAAVRVENI